MENNVILKIEHLTKYIGSRLILNDINLETYAGEVFGFLGPNGAGKTTTIKIVTGLLSLDEGKISVCGNDLVKDFEKALSEIGAIVENPEMYKYLSGYENLKQYARIRTVNGEKITKERIDEVVELVRLKNRINDKVGKYSLGMRQRLGVAQALLHKPSLLILDEPTNGLDPAGIKELRDILKDVAHNEGVAVLVSSHLMSEMQLMCDRVGIISNGRIISTHTVEELISTATSGKAVYNIKVSDAISAMNTARSVEGVEAYRTGEDVIKIEMPLENEKKLIGQINRQIIDSGCELYSVIPEDNKSLEEVFIELTQSGGEQIG